MLQFVSGQQADAPVQGVYDPAGVLLLSLCGTVETQPGHTRDKHTQQCWYNGWIK